MERYYLGLDMGTSSVGWAVTDEKYQIVRKKGKDLWGVRLFPEAQTAAERRTNRVARRRRQREKARIGYLRELFANEIQKTDPGFFQRLDDSKYFQEDKMIHQPFALFADSGYTDKEYFQEYPTIYHLRKELLTSTEPHDVRLVYLAVLNMFKHRGHFLNASLTDESIGNLADLFENLRITVKDQLDVELAYPERIEELENIFIDKSLSKTEKVEKIKALLKIDKKDRLQAELWKMICGLSGTLSVIFRQDNFSEEDKKYKLSFRDGNYDEKINAVAEMLSEESLDVLMLIKQIHDWGVLADIMRGSGKTYEYLSFARVDSYEKHKKDLETLKYLYKTYAPEKYHDMFRVMKDNNYSAYVGSVNAGNHVERRGYKHKTEDFYSALKKELQNFPESAERQYVLNELEKGTFLPKQLTASNGVVPNQVHMKELKKILANAEKYLAFLQQTDETGLSVSEKIIQLFGFQIPYYVGPLVNKADNHAWVVRKEGGRVFPWNFEQKVDVKRTSELFIQNMVNHCTYLSDEYVLPKNSLLYEKFMVLNELNNLRINGEKISVALKQDIYQDLFKSGKKVTAKRLCDYLIVHGYVDNETPIDLSGIDGDFVNRLANYKKFSEVFYVETLTYEQEQMAEQIIFWSTVYGDSKKFLREKIQENYGEVLSSNQIKRILGYKFRDWGRLSREFLLLEGADKTTGEISTIISRMWNENYNLMQLLSSEQFTYREEVEKKTKHMEKTLSEITYEDLEDLYISAPVRRMTWQTILILKELCGVLGQYPDKVFVEMAREHGEKNTRTVSRKKKFMDLYKSCKDEEIQWAKQIADTEESKFRSKKLYLYYTQKGRCMYTGTRIELSDLFNDNLYDIDHIYPRHFVKDDNIDNNLVLVKKQVNAHKSDVFPLERDIQKKQAAMWKELRQGNFITEEKYKRLTRNDPFTEEEQAGFISRQIVETRQGTKAITDLLQQTCPQSKIIYVKAGNVSAFRQKFDLIKCRNVNDLHHAQDAYLNIVVGNVYYTKFTSSPRNFVREYRQNKEKHPYHMYRLFDYDVRRGEEVAWEIGKDGKGKSISTVKRMVLKNTPLVTMMNFEVHGGLADQTLYSAKDAKDGEGYLPLKSSDPRLRDVAKYGGFTKYTGTYFFVVEYGQEKKRIRSIEAVPLYLAERLSDRENLEVYCRDMLGYQAPKIICRKIKMYSLMKINGFYLYLTGRTGTRLNVVNAVQMILDYENMYYVKRIADASERKYTDEDYEEHEVISKENNLRLYRQLEEKHRDTIYQKRPNPMGSKLQEMEGRFEELSIAQQVKVLLEILKLSQRLNQGADLTLVGGSKKTGVSLINKKITELKECKIVNQSVTGMYVNEVDLLKK